MDTEVDSLQTELARLASLPESHASEPHARVLHLEAWLEAERRQIFVASGSVFRARR